MEGWRSDSGKFAPCEDTPDELVDRVRAYKAAHPATIVIVCLHWGTEYRAKSSSFQSEEAHRLINAGADAIVAIILTCLKMLSSISTSRFSTASAILCSINTIRRRSKVRLRNSSFVPVACNPSNFSPYFCLTAFPGGRARRQAAFWLPTSLKRNFRIPAPLPFPTAPDHWASIEFDACFSDARFFRIRYIKAMNLLPSPTTMYRALVRKDSSFEGIFYVGVKTTGIFCRPTCSARKPKLSNVEFFRSTGEALYGGYRPCLRCRPLDKDKSAPRLVQQLSSRIEETMPARLGDRDLRKMGIDPSTARRQFIKYYGMTFHAYQRARRMGMALKRIREGENVIGAQIETGFESASGFWAAFKNVLGCRPQKQAPWTASSQVGSSRP